MFLACAIFISDDLDGVHHGDVRLGGDHQDNAMVAAVMDVHYNRDNHSSNNHHTNTGYTK